MGTEGVTAKVKRLIGGDTNCIYPLADGGAPLVTVLSSASLHDSQAAIPLMQMSSKRATILYDLADPAYDADEIKKF